jgi:hypothetical protein
MMQKLPLEESKNSQFLPFLLFFRDYLKKKLKKADYSLTFQFL